MTSALRGKAAERFPLYASGLVHRVPHGTAHGRTPNCGRGPPVECSDRFRYAVREIDVAAVPQDPVDDIEVLEVDAPGNACKHPGAASRDDRMLTATEDLGAVGVENLLVKLEVVLNDRVPTWTPASS